MADKGNAVAYIDRAGVEHVALVVGVNNLNPDVLDLAFFDVKADTLKTEFGVAHMNDPSKDESNPALPRYTLNCWKNAGDEHVALPADHAHFDHPFIGSASDQVKEAVAAKKAKPAAEPDVAAQLDAAGEPPKEEYTDPPKDAA